MPGPRVTWARDLAIALACGAVLLGGLAAGAVLGAEVLVELLDTVE